MIVVALDLLQDHVIQVGYAIANQIFLEQSALHAIQHIMIIQIVIVRIMIILQKSIVN